MEITSFSALGSQAEGSGEEISDPMYFPISAGPYDAEIQSSNTRDDAYHFSSIDLDRDVGDSLVFFLVSAGSVRESAHLVLRSFPSPYSVMLS